jgi:hypothetical protein
MIDYSEQTVTADGTHRENNLRNTGSEILKVKKSKATLVTGRGGSYVSFLWAVNIFCISKSKAIPITDPGSPYLFPLRYERHLHIKNRAIPVTNSRGPYVSFLWRTNIYI